MIKELIPNGIRRRVAHAAKEKNFEIQNLPAALQDSIISLVWGEALCSAIDSNVSKHYTEADLEDVS